MQPQPISAILLLTIIATVAQAQIKRGHLQNYTDSRNYCIKQLNIQSRPSTIEEMRSKCFPRCIFWRMKAITETDAFKLDIFPPGLNSTVTRCNQQKMNADSCVKAEQFAKCLNSTLLTQFWRYSDACVQETDTAANLDTLEDLMSNKFRGEKFNCYRRCLMIKAKVMNSLNELDVAYFNKLFSYDVQGIFAKCNQGNMQGNICQRAISRSKCAWNALYVKDVFLKKMFSKGPSNSFILVVS